MNKLLTLAACLLMTGCVTVSVDEPSICYSGSLNSLGDPPGPVPSFTFTQDVNISSTLNNINNVDNKTVINLTQLSLDNTTGDMSWVNKIDVLISTQTLPSVSMIDFTLTSTEQQSSNINLPVQASEAVLNQYFNSGAVTLTFTLSGSIPTVVPILNGTMCLSATGQVTKKI